MYIFLIIIHIIVSIFLIVVILLQAGRGSGVADTFGGSQVQSLFGTKSATILTRLTTICAFVFIFTCLSLAIMFSHRSRSLLENVNVPAQTQAQPVTADTTPSDTAPEKEPTPQLPLETQGGAGEAE